jgi:hypothetical protein
MPKVGKKLKAVEISEKCENETVEEKQREYNRRTRINND